MTERLSIITPVIMKATACFPGQAADWVRKHRLEPLVYGLELPGTFSSEFLDECRAAYLNMTGRALRYRAATDRMLSWLSGNGIQACAWRGVAYGEQLYGDPGLRYCTDIDLMVDAKRRFDVVDCLLSRGCTIRSQLLPRWYLARHHLHWPLMTPEGIPVDVHWAVDHPYRDTSSMVDVDSLQNPVGRLVAAICHVEKESRLRRLSSLNDMIGSVLGEGPVLPWIDLLLIRSQSTTEEISRAEQTFAEHGLSDLWKRTMGVAGGLLDPHAAIGMPTTPKSGPALPVAAKFAESLGCRAEALSDWFDYLVRSNSTAPGFLVRFGKIIRLALDTLICLPWMVWRKWRTTHARAVAG